MREITTHQVPAAPSALRILVLDEPGAGGANHAYEVLGFTNDPLLIGFQNGPIPEAGTNGITQEALLAIVLDRLQSFQAGKYYCPENELALRYTEAALGWLHRRTERRANAGTEGTHALDETPQLTAETLFGRDTAMSLAAHLQAMSAAEGTICVESAGENFEVSIKRVAKPEGAA